ncbi:hypothetical protein Stsp02_44270 [Streptomyces sp. NBRC 14336]|nr:hypothetical protein Stsp02_44270 [Streptomyces sp. NBRC 14336]
MLGDGEAGEGPGAQKGSHPPSDPPVDVTLGDGVGCANAGATPVKPMASVVPTVRAAADEDRLGLIHNPSRAERLFDFHLPGASLMSLLLKLFRPFSGLQGSSWTARGT